MQTCPECGVRNEDGELFCGSCGAFLEWEEQRVAAEVTGAGQGPAGEPSTAPSPAERVATEPATAGPVPVGSANAAAPPVVSTTAPGDGGRSGEDGVPRSDQPDDAAEPVPATLEAPRGSTPAGRAAVGGVLGSRASRMVRQGAATGGAVSAGAGSVSRTRSQVTSAATTPRRAAQSTLGRATAAGPATAPGAPRRPEARKPGAPVPRRRVPKGEEEAPPLQPGDLICGACGAGNAPHRNFCRRCGASLADAPVQQERSRWQRLLRPDPKPGPRAGTRPRSRRRRRFPTGLVVTLLVLALAGGAVWYFRVPLGDAYESVVDRVAGNDPIHPADVQSSSALADRPAQQAADGVSNRPWSPEGAGPGEWIRFELDGPRRLVSLVVTAGNGGGEEARLTEARPQRVRLTLTTGAGEQIEDVTLIDSGEPQAVPIGVSAVTAVQLTIQSVYGSELAAPVSFAEVEFRGRG